MILLYPFIEFAKNVDSCYVGTVTVLYVKFVSRQSDFAFFVRWLRLAHFFTKNIFYKEK